MALNPTSQIVQAERVDGGVAITFGDGRSFLFLASFLHAHKEDAEDITDLPGLDLPSGQAN